MFFQNLHCMFSPFTTLYQLDVQLQGSQYNLVGWYLILAFLKTTWRICPIKLGQKIFCITLCLGEITILNCGSERSSSLWRINDILSRTDFSYLFLFVLFFFFFYTDKNDYYHQQLTSLGIHMNKQERERHIKQNKICERLLLSCTNTYFFCKVAQ